MNQIENILNILKRGQRLTALEALNGFGCMNLKGRIWDIKQMGYSIEKEWIETSSGKRIAQYYIEETPIGHNYRLLI